MSILSDVKKGIGLDADYDAFDTDIIMHTNTVLRIVNQLGIGKLGYVISSEDPGSWSTFLGPRENELSEVKTYIYAKVRLIFDPPSVGSHVTALENIVKELEWRMNVQIDPPDYDWTNNY